MLASAAASGEEPPTRQPSLLTLALQAQPHNEFAGVLYSRLTNTATARSCRMVSATFTRINSTLTPAGSRATACAAADAAPRSTPQLSTQAIAHLHVPPYTMGLDVCVSLHIDRDPSLPAALRAAGRAMMGGQ